MRSLYFLEVTPAHDYLLPPVPRSAYDALRWEGLRLRRRMKEGAWRRDLDDKMLRQFGVTRRRIMGEASLAKNTFRRLCKELAISYVTPPQVTHPDGEIGEYLGRGGVLDRLGAWNLLKEMQDDLIGLREMLLRVDWSEDLHAPVVRLVTPDTVLGRAFASAPSVLVGLDHLQWRDVPGLGGRWCWDLLSIEDPQNPYFRVVVADVAGHGQDVTALIFGKDLSGDAYPYRWTQGKRAGVPFMPYVLYHADRVSKLWNHSEGIEVVEGTLNAAVADSYYQHAFFRAAFPQRWIKNGEVRGGVPVDGENQAHARSVVTDPASLIHFEDSEAGKDCEVGQFNPGADLSVMSQAIALIDRTVANFDGSDNSWVMASDTANPWSADALIAINEGKRAAQLRYGANLRGPDLELLGKLACICNLQVYTESIIPEDGYDIKYSILPLSPAELQSRREHADGMVASGRWSIVDAYLYEHPGMSRTEAISDLRRIASENSAFGVGVPQGAVGTPVPTAPKTFPSPMSSPPAPIESEGIELEELTDLVEDVARKCIPLESAVQSLIFMGVAESVARRILFPTEGFIPSTEPAGSTTEE